MYYLIEITEGDSKVAGKSIYEYETEDLAVASFHTKLGTAMRSELYTREQIMVIDGHSQFIESKVWSRVPTIEEETE